MIKYFNLNNMSLISMIFIQCGGFFDQNDLR